MRVLVSKCTVARRRLAKWIAHRRGVNHAIYSLPNEAIVSNSSATGSNPTLSSALLSQSPAVGALSDKEGLYSALPHMRARARWRERVLGEVPQHCHFILYCSVWDRVHVRMHNAMRSVCEVLC